MARTPRGAMRAEVWTFEDGAIRSRRDALAHEEPLEIRLHAAGQRQTWGTTMRTPGHDFELVAGTLFAEGIVQQLHDIVTMRYCVDSSVDGEQLYNVINVDLRADSLPDLSAQARHAAASSACGICGRASIDDLRRECAPLPSGFAVSPEVICALPEVLRPAQAAFSATGGLHAAALFSADGELLALREDIGRHNALDKLVGWALLNRRLPLHETVLCVSGRIGFEIAQKAIRAAIPVVAAISAPSSLAVRTAHAFDLTLVGFIRDRRFNIYSAPQRIIGMA